MKKIITLIAFSTLALAQQSKAQTWNTTGNTGTDPAVNFIGTTDSKALKIRTNNAVRVTINSAGKMGIGNTSPVFKLDVKGSINTDSLYRIGSNPVLSSIGWGNTFLGLTYNSGNTGTQNTFIGVEAGHYSSSGSNNSFIGYAAGANNTTGSDNTCIGQGAGYILGSGSYNTIIGKAAGYMGTNYSSSTFIGYAAGYVNTGNENSFIGYRSGQLNTSGQKNAFLGSYAGYSNSTGQSNTYMGGYSGYSNSAGNGNAYFGGYAGYANLTGNNNAAVGDSALQQNTNSGNTALGFKAGYVNTTGSNNTFIGYGAGSTGTNNLVNATAIGANASVTSGNCMVLGNNVNVGIGNTAPVSKMHITGSMEVLRLEGSNAAMQFKENGSLVGFMKASAGDFILGTNNTNINKLYFSTNGSNRMSIDAYGKVCIGNTTPATGYLVSIAGKAICTEMRVALQANWPDYVFNNDYKMLSLDELEQSVSMNKHLPGMLSASEMNEQGGIDLGAMQTKLVEKVEELTLYVIQLKKEINSLKESR